MADQLFENYSMAVKEIEKSISYKQALPPCAVCGQTRYWITERGEIRCGSKPCASGLRYRIKSIEVEFVPDQRLAL